jgi:hypothetical protein
MGFWEGGFLAQSYLNRIFTYYGVNCGDFPGIDKRGGNEEPVKGIAVDLR